MTAAAGAGSASGAAASPDLPIPADDLEAWRHRHLLDVDVLEPSELEIVMRAAEAMAGVLATPGRKLAALRGVGVTTLFYEASTRTRVSFEAAARALGADVASVTAASSSVSKGESVIDTVRTLEATGARILVMRHERSGAPHVAASVFGGSVVNAGDGWHAHPTQALLDLYTIRRHLGPDLAGRKVVILGDLLHSRVARSNLWTLTASGADVWVCGPAPLLRGYAAWGWDGVAGSRRFTVTTDVSAALEGASVIMALRIQKERMAAGLLPSLREYARAYGLSRERLALARPDAIVMHPGPMNEGVEIEPEVAAGHQSVVTEQVANGVAVRMAILALLANGRGGGRAAEAAAAARGAAGPAS